MKQAHFIAVCTLVVVALTLAVSISLDERDEDAATSPTASDKPPVVAKTPSRFQPRPLNFPENSHAITRSGSLDVRPGAGTAAGAAGSPDSAESRAKRVEAHARERLAELTKGLQLSGDQQRRLFPILARSALDYDPSMIVAGTPANHPPVAHLGGANGAFYQGGAGEVAPQGGLDESAAIYQELTPDQQALYEESLIDDGLWWADILAQIEQEHDMATPTAVSEPAVIDDPGADGNLFDLLGQ